MPPADGAPAEVPVPDQVRDSPSTSPERPIRVLPWFAAYTGLFAAGLGVLVVGMAMDEQSWADWRADPLAALRATNGWVKLLAFGLYISLCCTFLPLPTTGVVAAVSIRDVAVADGMVATALGVGAVGGLASMVANLNDYHAFVLLMRRRRVARIRGAGFYRKAVAWFNRSPMVLLTAMNLVPVPADIAMRMLAAASGYSRVRFAAANFIGRFLRYAVVAGSIYALGDAGWLAMGVLLAAAVLIWGIRWLRRRGAQPGPDAADRPGEKSSGRANPGPVTMSGEAERP